MKFFTPDALVCIDMWDKVCNADKHIWPTIQRDMHAFGGWIHHVIHYLRYSGVQIYHHDTSGATDNFRQDGMSIDKERDIILTQIGDIQKHDTVVLCGFHLERCVGNVEGHLKSEDQRKLGRAPNNIYLCMNLSLNYPGDVFTMRGNYCFWNNAGFTKI